uniref:(northern house mosquito) hypothetical protein n=1 Tax=Culex pipiens TaxID=7175 RepID=A0A8D8EUI1_CULPI
MQLNTSAGNAEIFPPISRRPARHPACPERRLPRGRQATPDRDQLPVLPLRRLESLPHECQLHRRRGFPPDDGRPRGPVPRAGNLLQAAPEDDQEEPVQSRHDPGGLRVQGVLRLRRTHPQLLPDCGPQLLRTLAAAAAAQGGTTQEADPGASEILRNSSETRNRLRLPDWLRLPGSPLQGAHPHHGHGRLNLPVAHPEALLPRVLSAVSAVALCRTAARSQWGVVHLLCEPLSAQDEALFRQGVPDSEAGGAGFPEGVRGGHSAVWEVHDVAEGVSADAPHLHAEIPQTRGLPVVPLHQRAQAPLAAVRGPGAGHLRRVRIGACPVRAEGTRTAGVLPAGGGKLSPQHGPVAPGSGRGGR